MNGIHDMGGMHGFGGIEREDDEPAFHAAWEKRAFGLALQAADGAGFSDDHLRDAIERIPAAAYLRASYYERWTWAVEAILMHRGLLGEGGGRRARGVGRGGPRGRSRHPAQRHRGPPSPPAPAQGVAPTVDAPGFPGATGCA